MTQEAPPLPATDPVATLLDLLRNAKQPLTFSKIRSGWKGPPITEDQLKQLLTEQTFQGNVFSAPSQNPLRYWHRDEEQLTREQLLGLLREKPRTKAQLVKDVKSKIKTGASNKWLEDQIQLLEQEGTIQQHPRIQRNWSPRLAVDPPDPTPYFNKTQFEKVLPVWQKLRNSGITPEQMWPVILAFLEAKKAQPTPAAPPLTPESSEPPRPSPPQPLPQPVQADESVPELLELILKGMNDLEPQADEGALVSIEELRGHLPGRYQGKDTFDPAIFRLSRKGKIALHRHNASATLSEEQRQQLVQDEDGIWYVGVARRV